MQVCTPEPQFPHPQSGDSNAHFVGMAGGPQTHGAVHGVGPGHVMWGAGGVVGAAGAVLSLRISYSRDQSETDQWSVCQSQKMSVV